MKIEQKILLIIEEKEKEKKNNFIYNIKRRRNK